MTLFWAAFTALAQPAGDQAKLVAANTAFAFDLMNQVARAEPEANVFISPFSVSCALQMVDNGAAGETRIEMERVLKTTGMPADSLNACYQDLARQFSGRQDVELNLANGLWCQKGFHLKPAFVKSNRKFFQAELAEVNFESPESAQAINEWAGRQTKGKIKEVVQFPFPVLPRLVLANAIYFKGTWVKRFEKGLTQRRDFHLVGGQSKLVPMMQQDGKFMYQETSEFQAVKLSYQGGVQMELCLPRTNSTPLKLAAGFLGGTTWRDKVQSAFSQWDGVVMLPKFKLEYKVKLNDSLKALGMRRAFTEGADFSGIADEPLSISDVEQKSYVDVNEEGTEAAAVTVVAVHALAIESAPPKRFTMVLDRPFFFVISDVATGCALFMGIVNDPARDGGS